MGIKRLDSFGSRRELKVGGERYEIAALEVLEKRGFSVSGLPFCMKVFLENLLRHEDGVTIRASDIEAVAGWKPGAGGDHEVLFRPARVLMQDFTGVPALVDLAAMRDAMKAFGGDPEKINPSVPVDLVVDHSVQVDAFGDASALAHNTKLEYERNRERYLFLKWGQKAFRQFRVVPPETGIVHQVNLEYLARVVWTQPVGGKNWAYPDSLVGTDSHTTMINGLGVLGWGVGGIEAEAVMLGQPLSMLIPQVVGFRLSGRLPAGATATDLVLTVTQMLRQKGVVGKFVEFFGPGLNALSLADRATIANMCPEYGATIGYFPVDDETLSYLELTGRSKQTIQLVDAYHKAQGMYRTAEMPDAQYSDVVALNLDDVVPSMAGPRLPQQRVALSQAGSAFQESLSKMLKPGQPVSQEVQIKIPVIGSDAPVPVNLHHGAVVIAAITSCTNTSNPSVMMAAGLLARKARERGLQVQPWVKTSLAPGSQVVVDYLKSAGLLSDLEALGFYLVGFGCTTCIGNSGPLPEPITRAVKQDGLVVSAVLSGNRNFEGRIHPDVKAAYLASPPLVVAYALVGRMDLNLTQEPIGKDKQGQPVYLKDIWPTPQEIQTVVQKHLNRAMFDRRYGQVFEGNESWKSLEVAEGALFQWNPRSTYVRKPPYFEGLPRVPRALEDIRSARVLVMVGDSVTTDHISPAGNIAAESPASHYLQSQNVARAQFNSYGSRRGNHEVMMRGTFANVRLKNLLAPGTEGWWTLRLPEGEKTSIFDAAQAYQKQGIPCIVLAGKEYGSGSSRDWAAKGPALLGVRAVIAESYERIHRSNLIGMGVLPLQYCAGQTRESLGITGHETFDILALAQIQPRCILKVLAQQNGKKIEFKTILRIDTPAELDYLMNGGILQYVLRQMLNA